MELSLPQAEGRLVPRVERIAVLKGTALGDFVQLLPALDALRWAYPAARITLLGRPSHRELLSGRASPVDEVLVVPDGAIGDEPVGPRPEERQRFLGQLRGQSFDLALQMHGGGRNSNPFIRGLGARVTAGSGTPDAVPLDRTLHYDVHQPEVLRYIEVAALVGARRAPLEPRLGVTEADIAESLRVVLDDGPPLVVLHPGATDPRRRWPPERFAAIGDALCAAGARVVVTGVEQERAIVEEVVRHARAPLLDVAARLSLSGLVGLLARASLLVSNDTGPRHLAAALGTATVGVYWIGNVLTAAPLVRGRHRLLISWRADCPLCGRDCVHDNCAHRASFVADVPLEAVLAEALELFETEAGAERLPSLRR